MIKLTPKKKRADVAIMVAVFCVAFLALCAFGIDMAYITLNRAKLQRATETTALAAIAQYKDSGVDKSKELFKLYKSEFDTIKDANITSVQYKTGTDGSIKLKISTELNSPTYFLRFAGVGGVKIEANSYTKTYEEIKEDVQSGETVDLDSIITNKKGNDIKIKTKPNSYGYFVFAGKKNTDGTYLWSDMGCKSNTAGTQKNIDGKNYTLICSQEENFDFSNSCSDNTSINVADSIVIFSAKPLDCPQGQNLLKDIEERAKDSNTPITFEWLLSQFPKQDSNPYEITILNNVKLITKDDFLR